MIKHALRPLRIVHAALIVSLGIYGVMLAVILNQPPGQTGTPIRPAPAEAPPVPTQVTSLNPTLMLGVFLGLAALTFLVIIPVVRRVTMPPRERVGDGNSLDMNAPVDAPLAKAFAKLRVGSIATWALCESVAIYGFIMAFLFRKPVYYAGFGAAAALAMIFFAPSKTLFEQVVRAARR